MEQFHRDIAGTGANDVGRQRRSYRCYLLNGDRIVSVHIIECDDDASAVLEADRVLQASTCQAVEIWQRQHQVSILSKAP